MPADDWLAPPVPTLSSEAEPATKPEPRGRRSGTYIIIGLLLLVSGGAGGWIWWHGLPDPEETQRQQLAALYEKASQNREYAELALGYDKLAKEFPESEHVNEYRFYAALCRLLQDASAAIVAPDKVMEKLRGFLAKSKTDPLLENNRVRMADVFRGILEKHIEATEKLTQKKPIPSKDIDDIDKAIALALRWGEEGNPYWIDGAIPGSIRAKIDELNDIVAKARYREDFIASLKKMARPTLKSAEEAALKRRRQDLAQDAEVAKAIDDLWRRAIPTVEYVRDPRPAEDAAPPTPVGLVVAPRLDNTPPAPMNSGVVFALVRGILYGLAENDGHVLWTTARRHRHPAPATPAVPNRNHQI